MGLLSKLYSIEHNIAWIFLNIKNERQYKKDNPEYLSYISSNSKYRNLYKGKRCFILGNGPSIQKIDFSLLKDEITFCVNQISRNENYYKLNTTFHVWGDRVFFDIDDNNSEDLELLETMKAVGMGRNKPVVLYEYRAKNMIEKYGLQNDLDIEYFAAHTLDFNTLARKNELSMNRLMPDFPTVIQIIICMAIYMGFSQIILLGCDCTGYVNSAYASLKKSENANYGYEVSENEKKRMEKIAQIRSVRDELASYVKIFDNYDLLYKYCCEKNIELLNATEGSVLECIPKIKLEELF